MRLLEIIPRQHHDPDQVEAAVIQIEGQTALGEDQQVDSGAARLALNSGVDAPGHVVLFKAHRVVREKIAQMRGRTPPWGGDTAPRTNVPFLGRRKQMPSLISII